MTPHDWWNAAVLIIVLVAEVVLLWDGFKNDRWGHTDPFL